MFFSDTKQDKVGGCWGAVLVALSVVCASSSCRAEEAEWSGPSFRDFSGACQADPVNPERAELWRDGLGWNRDGLSWQKWQPEPGVWEEAYFLEVEQDVRMFLERDVQVLLMLGYNTGWSSEMLSLDVPYEVTYGDTWRREIEVLPDGNYEARTYTRPDRNGFWSLDRTFIIKKYRKNKIPLAPEYVPDWENYVRKSVAHYRKPPFEMVYFQVWNEAHPKSGFWDGNLDDYMTRVHLPAAKIIHELGGKVVYGGWIHGAPISELVELLDRHDAWDSIDVLDVHYMPPKAFAVLRSAADERGRQDMGIWQTEMANSPHAHFVSNNYPRFLYWALTNDWDYADKYKLFFFSYKSPKLSERETAVNRTLYQGDDLSPHGISLNTLGELLKGDGLHAYTAVHATPDLSPQLVTGKSGMEVFTVGNRVVASIHVGADIDLKSMQKDGSLQLSLSFPEIQPGQIDKIERVDIAGERLALAYDSMPGGGVNVVAPVSDKPGSNAEAWNGKSTGCRTFYVVLTLNTAIQTR